MTNAVTLRNSLLLAPLLGVTGSLVNALSWGLMLLTVVVAYAVAMRGLRPRLTESLRLPASVILAATFTGCADLALQLHSLPLHHSLGFYPGLIGLQCVVLEMNGFFIHHTLRHRLRLLGLSACLLLLLGAVRELLGSGSLGNHWGWLAGSIDDCGALWIWVTAASPHLLALTPGSFILLGLLIAARQAWARRARPDRLDKESDYP